VSALLAGLINISPPGRFEKQVEKKNQIENEPKTSNHPNRNEAKQKYMPI
jgi:hypothetical protein